MNATEHEAILLTTDGELIHPQPVTGSEPYNPVLKPSPNESGARQAIRTMLRIGAPFLLALLCIVYFAFDAEPGAVVDCPDRHRVAVSAVSSPIPRERDQQTHRWDARVCRDVLQRNEVCKAATTPVVIGVISEPKNAKVR